MRALILAFAITVAAVVAEAPVFAADTIVYSYDARGRLVEVKRTSNVSTAPAPTTTVYQFDKANNRLTKTITSP
jgi:glycerol-3-phosphate cytidylyltransferase-like family protein